MPEIKLPPVREKLEQIRDAAIADGRIPSADGGGPQITMPSFSKQTVALDDNGKPILDKNGSGRAPADFAEGEKIPPVVEGTIAAPVAIAPLAPAAQAAVAAEVGATPAVAPAAAVAGAEAAEAAATAVVDDYVDFDFDDPDLGQKFTLKAPKGALEIVKRGYGRRTAYDRAVNYLKNAEPVLKTMIEDGRIQRLMPFLQRAVDDAEFAQAVSDVYDRRVKGEPMLQAAVRELQAPPTPPAGAPPQEPAFVDPFVDPRIQTLEERLAATERTQQEWRDAQARTQQTQQQRQEQVQRNVSAMSAAHRTLANMYPGKFRPELGDKDPAWNNAYQYAQDAGYLTDYDLKAACVFGGQGWQQVEADRIAATMSPAATAIAATEARLLDTATREAAAAARTVSGGAAGGSVPAVPPAKPLPTNPDGTLKPKEQFMAEAVAWRQQYGTA